MRAPTDRPVFVFAQHRSGGTLLARALNCHPDLLIWGEHGGIANHLAALDATVCALGPLMDRRAFRDADGPRALKERTAAAFDAWAHPFDRPAWLALCRTLLRSTFARHATATQRWGFKEIRYHRPEVAELLQELFPRCRFVLLRREIRALCRSNLLVGWSASALASDGATDDPALARQAIEDCLFALLAMRAGFDAIETRCAPVVHAVAYERLHDPATIAGVFAFLRLRAEPAVMTAVTDALERRLGETTPPEHGCLTVGFINATIDEILPRVAAEVAATDPADLPVRVRSRHYGFLAGDHDVRGSGYSAMF